jgi:predicted nucleic acid-binding Zn ribbon protein
MFAMLHRVSQRHATPHPVCGNSLKANVNRVIILKKEAIFYSIFDTHISEIGSVIRCKGAKDSTQLGTSVTGCTGHN